MPTVFAWSRAVSKRKPPAGRIYPLDGAKRFRGQSHPTADGAEMSSSTAAELALGMDGGASGDNSVRQLKGDVPYWTF